MGPSRPSSSRHVPSVATLGSLDAAGRGVSLRIAVVGGLERHEAELERRAEQLGHTVEFHRGRMGGRRTEELEAIVSRSELVIIVTQVNSHGAMHVAKRIADRLAHRALVVRTCSPSAFRSLLESAAAAPLAGGAMRRIVEVGASGSCIQPEVSFDESIHSFMANSQRAPRRALPARVERAGRRA